MISSHTERLTSMSVRGMTVTPLVRVRSFRWTTRRFAVGWTRVAPTGIEIKNQDSGETEIVRVGGWRHRPATTAALGMLTVLAVAATILTRRST